MSAHAVPPSVIGFRCGGDGNAFPDGLGADGPCAEFGRNTGPVTVLRLARMSGMTQAHATAPDLNDVKYDAFLANYRTLADPDIALVEPSSPVLLRVINSSSTSNFHLDLGQLNGELIAVDGFRVVPMMVQHWNKDVRHCLSPSV